MALETLNNLKEVNGFKVVVMDELRTKYPEKFNESGAMDYKWFEKDIRPFNFIYVRHDVNSLSFTLQNGPVKEKGVNGCQITDVIEVAKHMITELNEKFPCPENENTITFLGLALEWQKRRTTDRLNRGVEGTSQC